MTHRALQAGGLRHVAGVHSLLPLTGDQLKFPFCGVNSYFYFTREPLNLNLGDAGFVSLFMY